MSHRYLKGDRLGDVLALIQVLALDEDTHRSEKGLESELQGMPRSARSWEELSKEHPEFFRVYEGKGVSISLVARHVTPKNEEIRKLDNDFVQTLLKIAVDLHDREAKRHDRLWQVSQTIAAGLVGGLLSQLPSLFHWLATFYNIKHT